MRSIRAWRADAESHPRPEWFSGPVWIQTLNGGTDPSELEIFAVFFDAGARTLPHIHSTDQFLCFLEGEGMVATPGERWIYGPGGMAVVPANEWHWHGATPTSPTCHLSIRPGGPTTWAPEVPLRDWETYMEGAIPAT
jgi:quercetin dioxygenase-like cupin family protein